MSYSEDFRKRTIEYLSEGHSYKQTNQTFKISESTLAKWVKQYQTIGSLKRKYREYPPKVDLKELEKYVSSYPDAYQSEIAEHFCCSQPTIFRLLKRLGITRKKRQSVTKSNQQKK